MAHSISLRFTQGERRVQNPGHPERRMLIRSRRALLFPPSCGISTATMSDEALAKSDKKVVKGE